MTFGRRPVRALALAFWLAMAASAPAAWAQPTAGDMETARTLYQEGKQLRDAGDLAGALEKFKAAHALGRTPITGINLAEAYEAVGSLVEARETCLSILRISVQPNETQRSTEAREQARALAKRLEPRIPSVVVAVTGLEPGVAPKVVIDGHELPPAAVGLVRKVNPGKHEVVANAPGYYEARESFSVKEAERTNVELTLQKAPPGALPPPLPGPTRPAPPPAPGRDRERASGMSPLAVTGFIVAGSGAAVGTLAGLLAMSKASDLESACNADKQCPPDSQSDIDSGRTFGTVSTVAFGLAAVGLTVGIFSLASDDADERQEVGKVTPWLGIGSAGMRGVF